MTLFVSPVFFRSDLSIVIRSFGLKKFMQKTCIPVLSGQRHHSEAYKKPELVQKHRTDFHFYIVDHNYVLAITTK